LFSECPDISDKQNHQLFENNKILRLELERSSTRLKITEEDLEKRKKEISKLKIFES
jgi:hypothetical protein